MNKNILMEVRESESARSFFNRIQELLFCHFQGHYNFITPAFSGKFISRNCQKCGKRVELCNNFKYSSRI